MISVERAELVAVGTELLLGEINDTNSAYLAQALAARSVDVYWSRRVGDNRARITEAILAALERADLVVLCGGLGPTDDDLTREAIADALGETPSVDPTLEAELRARFARFSRTMPAGNVKQAWLIASAEALPNPNGTAPGWFVRVEHGARTKVVVALPGPPRELVPMWLEQVVPRLRFPVATFAARTLKTFGIGESHLAERLVGLTERANPSVATYEKRDGVHVRIAAKAENADAAGALLAPVVRDVRARLDGHVWGEDADELAALVVARLRRDARTLVVIDGGTGGSLAELLGAIDDATDGTTGSGPLIGAVIAWRNEAMALLGVAYDGSAGRPPKDESEATVVAAELAERGRARCAADYGVGIAPWWSAPTETAPDRPTRGSAWAVAGPEGTEARPVSAPQSGHASRRERLAFTALVGLWTQLSKT
ncbi:CinA family nicotinamide mononucleotide deamidase-related protein [soil metagenome]